MSGKRALTGLMLIACSFVVVADEEIPEIDFIEYLGLWEESDKDWLLFSEPYSAGNNERSDPAPEGEESTEKKDEI